MKIGIGKFKLWLVVVLAVIVILPGLWFLVVHLEGQKPVIEDRLPESIGKAQKFQIDISDEKSGLRMARVAVIQADKEKVLFEKNFEPMGFLSGGKIFEASIPVEIDKKTLDISDGPAVFLVEVTDYSWRRWWNGNRAVLEKNILIDTKPPGVEVFTRAHNINQGGVGLVVYRLSENCPKSGVMVGDNFFPGHAGYFEDPLAHLCFFALDYTQGKGTEIYLLAVDEAGNERKAGFYYHIRNKKFKQDIINLPDRFLNWKMPEFDVEPTEDTGNPMLDKFLAVNRQLREKNGQFLQSLTQNTDKKMHWEGTFLRLPNAAPRAGFADHRQYRYQEKEVDRQVHLGIDLASLEKSPVPASNTGKVVFAGEVGIYGNTVMIDHGFGLFSFYSHLSTIDVEVSQMVSKGEQIGLTGVTGLAGGDHLHYAMMVHNTMVNPIEWWDSNWIMHNVTDKLQEVGEFLN